MKTMYGRLVIAALALLGISGIVSCHKETSASSADLVPAGKSRLSVFITDGPTGVQQVLVDIRSIQVLVDTCQRPADTTVNHRDEDHEGDDDHHGDWRGCANAADSCLTWNSLPVNAGVYDLLSLRNGNDTLLGSGFVPNGRIVAIKISLGSNNSVMVDSVSYPLNFLDSQTFSICLRGEDFDSVSRNEFNLLLDFNLTNSIHFDFGRFWFSPSCRAYSRQRTGSIEGEVNPEHSFGMIKAFNATDTAYALPWDEGEFKIRGLKAGSYSVWIQGANGYKDSTISNVVVDSAKVTELGRIVLHQ